MKKYVIALLAIVTIACARPNQDNVPHNMVTVPTNCPEGQQLINGICRDVWKFYPSNPNTLMANEAFRRNRNSAPLNMVTVPTNCPEGQQLVNGVCRDIWKFGPTSPIPPKAVETKNKLLDEIVEHIRSAVMYQREKRQVDFEPEEVMQILDYANTDRNIISVPNQCPIGYKPDFLGICRPIFN